MDVKNENVVGDEFDRFYQQLLRHSQLTERKIFLVGSMAELIIVEDSVIMIQFGLNKQEEDLDNMQYSINEYVFPRGRHVPESHSGEVLIIDSDAMHPEYTKLIRRLDSTEIVQNRDRSKQYHGPAEISYYTDDMEDVLSSLTRHEKENMSIYRCNILEKVYAVHSPYWPDEASEWGTRTRHYASPSKSVIKQVVRYGCDFVCVSHKLSPNKDKLNEFRFSFSVAERIIIRYWTDSQRIVYRVLVRAFVS